MADVFEDGARHLAVSEKTKQIAWKKLLELGIGTNYPEALSVLLKYALEEQAERISSGSAKQLEESREETSRIIGEARDMILSSTKETVGKVRKAAADVERASAAKLAVQQGELVASVSSQIAASADKALTRKVIRQDRNAFASWIGAAVIISGIACFGGYQIGKSNADANAARVNSLSSREDGSVWSALAEANNAKATISTYCQTGSANVHRVQGGVYCQVPLWLQHDGVVSPIPGGIADPSGLWASVTAWVASWGPWWLLSAGALAFLVLRLLAAWTIEFEPLRRILALPSKSAIRAERYAGE